MIDIKRTAKKLKRESFGYSHRIFEETLRTKKLRLKLAKNQRHLHENHFHTGVVFTIKT